MRTSFAIGRVFGIEVRVHVSLIVILALLVYAFYISPPPLGFRDLENSLVLSILASLLVVLAILVHELAHSLVAMNFGVRVRTIVLFIFGGVAMMEEIPREPKKEFMVAAAGPSASFALAFVSLALTPVLPFPISRLSVSFAYLNVILALFNLLPAFPMDGGRILRSFLAARMGYARATKIAAEAGRMFAVLMAIFGLFYNYWLILIALFIYMGANEEERLVTLEEILGRVRVRDVMTREVLTVTPETRVAEVLELMLKHKHLGYPVVEDGRIVGVVTLKDIINANPDDPVANVMSRSVVTISPDATAFEAFKLMSENEIGRLLVTEDGKLVGIVTRSDIMKAKELLEAMEVLGWRGSR
ncbi:MAG: CBS domain-containing protein [Archaeoglobaceae archaeon]